MQFLKKVGFRPYATVANSWDSFNEHGSVMMHLWANEGHVIRKHSIPRAYFRVRCFDGAHFAQYGKQQKTEYAGRLKAIEPIKNGVKGYAALSAPSVPSYGPDQWAKYANFDRVYPILGIAGPDP